MAGHASYLVWILLFWVTPQTLCWLRFGRDLARYWPAYLLVFVEAFALALPWDAVTASLGIWQWPAAGSLPWRLLGMPLEEYLGVLVGACQLTTFALSARIILARRERVRG